VRYYSGAQAPASCCFDTRDIVHAFLQVSTSAAPVGVDWRIAHSSRADVADGVILQYLRYKKCQRAPTCCDQLPSDLGIEDSLDQGTFVPPRFQIIGDFVETFWLDVHEN
jgi:hypothetical protein